MNNVSQCNSFVTMFTGLIEEIGKIEKIKPIASGKRIAVNCNKVLSDIKIDDSIAVNGVCLTVIGFDKKSFTVEAVGDTLDKTTIGDLTVGVQVNLERALKLSDRLGGHLVQGHVNGVGEIYSVTKRGDNFKVEITTPDFLGKYFITEGSVAIDGISLTIASITNSAISFSIIPHTWNNTNLKYKSLGSRVNIEVDMIAKYVENFLTAKGNDAGLTIDKLRNAGY